MPEKNGKSTCLAALKELSTLICGKTQPYPRGVCAFSRGLNLATEPEVSDLTNERGIDENVASRQVTVDVVHLRQVLHPGRNAPQHPHQLKHLELPVVHLKSLR